jgi:TonB family protein
MSPPLANSAVFTKGERVMRGLVAAALAVVVVTPAVEAQPIDLERALARPISPGAVALLVEHAHEPRARQRLIEALADERAGVRAAAARVVDASGMAQLVPDVTAALAKESDADAAIEMLRAVANLGDATGDSVLIEASRRLGLGNVAGPALAAGRGAPALDELDSFRVGKDPSFPLKDVLRLASRGNRDVLEPLVAKAFREEDVELWAAYLELARDTEARVSDGDLLFGLSSDTFRVETLWHLLLADVETPEVEPRVNELIGERNKATDVEDQFLRELMARKRGDKPRESREWIARRSSNEGTKLSGIRELPPKPVLALLTKDERRALSAQMTGDPEFLDEERKRAEKAASLGVPVAPRATTRATGTLRAVAGFPPGFAADLLEVTDCHPRSMVGIANASVRFSLDGRPEQATFAPASTAAPGAPADCLEASRALILNSLLEPRYLSNIANRDRLLVLLEPEFLSCLAESTPRLYLPSGTPGKKHKTEPPTKTGDVAPVYPESAKRERIQGMVILTAVITESGCVQGLSVLKSPDDRLSVVAIVAVSRWRYRPARIDGTPVPIVMTVSVNFDLK